MLIIRIYLLAGLVFHKAVWEYMKRPRKRTGDEGELAQARTSSKAQANTGLQLVKLVKVAILLGIAAQTLLPEIFPISADAFILRVTGLGIYTAGLYIAIRGRLELGSNWSDIESAQVLRDQAVVAKGLYRLIRHPIYVGDLLLLLGLELSLNSWLVLGVVLLAPVVMLQAMREEKKLTRALPGYQDYCTQTKRFIPFVV